jgi:hypothetical protein
MIPSGKNCFHLQPIAANRRWRNKPTLDPIHPA